MCCLWLHSLSRCCSDESQPQTPLGSQRRPHPEHHIRAGRTHRRTGIHQHGASMKSRQKLVCDEIMYIVSNAYKNADNPLKARFGIKGLAERLDGKATLEESAEAIQHLLDAGHLNKQGQYCVGLPANRKKVYSLHGYDPFALIPNKKPSESKRNELATSQISNVQKMHIANSPKDSPEKPAKVMTASDVIAGSFGNKKREQIKPSSEPDYAAFNDETTPSADGNEFQSIEQSLSTLKARLNRKPVENLTIKLRTLDGLARLLDPEISEVLNQIQNDLKEIAQ